MCKEARQSSELNVKHTNRSDASKEFSQIFHVLCQGKQREVQKNASKEDFGVRMIRTGSEWTNLGKIKRQREVCAPGQGCCGWDPLWTSGCMGVKGWKYKDPDLSLGPILISHLYCLLKKAPIIRSKNLKELFLGSNISFLSLVLVVKKTQTLKRKLIPGLLFWWEKKLVFF